MTRTIVASGFSWLDFQKLHSSDDLESYFSNRAYRHEGFYHYTQLSVANNILSGRKFWLSNVRGFNDIIDREQFGSEAATTFSLCFSTGVHENLPLWYMYSGLDGKGARIGFTSAQVKALIENGKYVLCQKKTDGKSWLMELEQGICLTESDFETEFRDVLYSAIGTNGGESGNAELKYSTLVNYKIPKDDVRKYLGGHRGFSKKLIWSYERETRLVVRLKGDAVTYMKNKYQNVDKPTDDCQFVVTLDFGGISRVGKGMKITLGPNTKSRDEVINDSAYSGIKRFCLDTSNISASAHAGEFAFDFCRNCPKAEEVKAK